MNSLSKTGKQKLNIWKKQFRIRKYSLGNRLFKFLVREIHLDTNQTTSWIRTQFSSLDKYMMTISSNIGKFNFYVQTLMGSLKDRGETSTDLLTILFKGYAECSDKTSVAYMARKKRTTRMERTQRPSKRCKRPTKNLRTKN